MTLTFKVRVLCSEVHMNQQGLHVLNCVLRRMWTKCENTDLRCRFFMYIAQHLATCHSTRREMFLWGGEKAVLLPKTFH